MIPFLRMLAIRTARQLEFTLRAPAASASITAQAVADQLRAARDNACSALSSIADRMDDDTSTPCVDCGAPGGTHVDNPCDSDTERRLGFVDRVTWQRRKFARRQQGAA